MTATDQTPQPPQAAAVAEPSPCGTQAGYQRHLSYGEPTCADCRRSNAERVRAIRTERGRSNPDRERRWAAALMPPVALAVIAAAWKEASDA